MIDVETKLTDRGVMASTLDVRVMLPPTFSSLPPHEQERELERAMTSAWEAMKQQLRVGQAFEVAGRSRWR